MSEPRDFHRFMELAERQQSASASTPRTSIRCVHGLDELVAALPESRPWVTRLSRRAEGEKARRSRGVG